MESPRSSRKGVAFLAVGAACVAALTAGVFLLAAHPDSEAQSEPTSLQARSPSDPLHDAALKDLIQNARVASLRRDPATRNAMLSGLRRDSVRARELIESEIAKATDPKDREILSQLLRDLP